MSIREETSRWIRNFSEFLQSLQAPFKRKAGLAGILSETNADIHLSRRIGQAVKVTASEIIINPDKLGADDRSALDSFLLRKAFEEEGFPFIQEDALGTVREIQQSTDRNQAVIAKLQKHIPPADLAALRISLLIRERAKKRLPVDALRQQLFNRYGRRGQTICNLCGRGYLEGEILSNLKKFKGDKRFAEYYEEMIQASGYAVFVHSDMADIEQAIYDAADKNYSYKKRFVRIYGIGADNVKRIETAVGTILGVQNSAFQEASRSKKGGKLRIELKYLRP